MNHHIIGLHTVTKQHNSIMYVYQCTYNSSDMSGRNYLSSINNRIKRGRKN